jgi:putative membrane protein
METGSEESAKDPTGAEPDYRFTLANERTFLAWIRTSLALLAAAVALGHLLPGFGPDLLRKIASVALAVAATGTAAISVLRWRGVQEAVDRGDPLPRSVTPWVLSGLLLAIGVIIGVLVITSGT